MTETQNIDLPAFQEQVQSMIKTILYFENLPEDEAIAFSSGSEISKQEAENYIKQPDVKQRVCAAISGLGDDLYDLTKEITRELWLATVAGLFFIPQNPLVYAWIALLVYRASVNFYCAEYR